MRRLLIVGVVIVSGVYAATGRAQDRTPPLQRLIHSQFEMRLPLTFCDVPGAVTGLARRLQLVAGIEYLPGDCQAERQSHKRSNDVVLLTGLTVEQALDKLVEIDPRYRWVESDGVVLVRPIEAWGDPKNWLNQPIGSFVMDDQDLGSALAEVVCRIPDAPCRRSSEMVMRTELGARRFSVNLSASSLVGALNAIVSAHGALWWEARDHARPTTEGEHRMLWFHTPDESGLGMPTKHYPSKPGGNR